MTQAEASGQDQFKPAVNHRAGYGTEEERTGRLLAFLERHPGATLASGEGDLLRRRILELQAELADLLRRNPDAEHTRE